MNDDKEINKGLKFLVKSSFIVFIGLFLSKLFFYIYRLIVARSFGPEVYGLFSLSIIILLGFATIFSFGLDQGLLRFISLYRGKKEIRKIRYLFKFSTKFLIISSIISAILLFFLSEPISEKIFNNPGLTIFLKIFAFLIPIYIFSIVFLSVLRAYEKISWYSFILNILQNGIKLIFLILFIFIGFKINAIIFSYFLGISSMLLVSYFVLRKDIKEIFSKDTLEKLKEKRIINRRFLAYSWPIMFFGIIDSLFYWIDSLSVGYFRNVTEVGFYNAAVPIAALMGFAPELFMQLFFPLITKEFSRKRLGVIKQLSKQVGKWIFVLNLPLFIIMFFFPEALINLLFGEKYIIAGNTLRILAFGTFLATLSVSIPKNLLSMKGKSKLLLKNILFVCIINLLLNIILVPRYGIEGAAFSTTIVNIILGAILLIQTKQITSIIPFKKSMLKILMVSIIPTILLIYSTKIIPINNISMILLVIFFILLYIFLLFLTKCLDKNDIMILNSIKEKYIYKKFKKS